MAINLQVQTVKSNNLDTNKNVNTLGVLTLTEKDIHFGTGTKNITYGGSSYDDTELKALINNKLDTSTYDTDKVTYALKSEIPSTDNLVTKDEITDFITSDALTDYAKTTDIPDITNLATKDELNALDIPDVSNLATKDELSLKANTTDLDNYATTTNVGDITTLKTGDKTSVVNAINEIDTAIENIKASGYDDSKLRTEISNWLAEKQDKLTAGDNITIDDTGKISATSSATYDDTELNNKITAVENSLATKVNISTLSNYLKTETYTADKDTFALKTDIPDISNLATKDELPDITGLAKQTDVDTKDTELETKITGVETKVGTLDNLTTTAKDDLVLAINEVNGKSVDLSDYYTKAEVTTELGNYVTSSDVEANYVKYTEAGNLYATKVDLDTKIDKTSLDAYALDDDVLAVSNKIGVLDDLTTTSKENVVASLNEIEAKVEQLQLSGYDDTELRTLISAKADQSSITEINDALGNTSTLGSDNIIDKLSTMDASITSLSSQAMTQIGASNAKVTALQTNQGTIDDLTTNSKTLVGAINEVKESVANVDHSAFATKTDVANDLATKVDTSTLDNYMLKTDIEAADTAIKDSIGTLTNLTTTEQSTLVGAINEIDSDITKLEAADKTLQTNIDTKVNQTDYNSKVTELETKDSTLEQSVTTEKNRATAEEQRLQNEIDAKTKAAVYASGTEFKKYDFVIHANKIYLVGATFTASGNFSNDSNYLVALQDEGNMGVVTYATGISIKNGQTVLHNTDDGRQELYICTQDIETTTDWASDSTKMVSYGASINLDNYYNKSEVDDMLSNKMDTLAPGKGVTVSRGDTSITVSADMDIAATASKIVQRGTEGEANVNTPTTLTDTTVVNNKQLTDQLANYVQSTTLSNYVETTTLDNYVTTSTYNTDKANTNILISSKQNTLTAGDNIEITNNVIKSTYSYDDTEVKNLIAQKQNTLIAGEGIEIDTTTNTIKSTLTGIEVVDTMPSNPVAGTIYFVRATS